MNQVLLSAVVGTAFNSKMLLVRYSNIIIATLIFIFISIDLLSLTCVKSVNLKIKNGWPKGQRGANGLKGTLGAQGPKGMRGSPGPSGIDGSKGHKGIAGIPGPRGLPGQDGLVETK